MIARFCGCLAAIPLLFASLASAQGDPLYSAIMERDAEYFDVYFNRCDPARVTAMSMPDLEFYHDKGGVVATSAKQFVADYEKDCTAKKAPDAWRSRREAIAGSVKVYPVPEYGAIEEGSHVFYERKGNGPEKLVGKGRFLILWKNDGGIWKLARIFSYDHGPAGE